MSLLDPSSSSSLRRNGSRSSTRSGLVPSPRPSYSNLNEPGSADSSASGSRNGSFISTPRLLSRRNSAKDKTIGLFRKVSVKETHEVTSPILEPAEVIETPHVRMDRDPDSGRKMINQYLVLNEIGHGTHGRVRLGQDLSDDGTYYAIKIVDRNPKRKRLTGLARQRASVGKMVNENEIRKEIAIFKKVNHPNVVRMKEIIDDPDSSKLFMILEYCERGEIHWKDHGGPALDLAEIRRILRQTVLGLEYLHHQGIIHRDIKPSNLLLSSDGTVKISDFGCSHYSEALRSASARPEADEYVDDIELAKTAGSPAFFAPEMCYSGEPLSPAAEVPAFSLRPPSGAESGLSLVMSNDSSLRSAPRRERLPITNAIDVWALGVTLYCLLFGKTPFDAANEYLLMQVIPVAEIELPSLLARNQIPSTERDGAECLDLLLKLLEKDPAKRITLEQIKKHPFTLHGLSDPTAWLASTDPHAQSFVTVSNDEVAQVVVKSSSFRAKLKKGVSTIANRLQIISNARHRSRSIGQDDPAAVASPTLSRRFSILGAGSPRRPSPRLVVHDEPGSPALRRRQSSDIDSLGRQRSPSSASSNSHFGSKIVRLLSRNESQRHPNSPPQASTHPTRASIDTFDSAPQAELAAELAEEVDWNETLSDEEDFAPVLRPSAPNFGWQEEAEDLDDGLAIATGSRRRKGSMRL